MSDRGEAPVHLSSIAPILATKLHIPRAVARTMERRRLIERMNVGLRNKVSGVSGRI